MKRLTKALAALAVINLLGILGAVGWLVATERLNAERVRAIREILQETIPAERARLAAAQTPPEAPPSPEEQPLPGGPPVSAQRLVAAQEEQAQADEFRTQRLASENSKLGQTIVQETRKLDKARKEFEEQKALFEQRQEQIAALKGDEQFQAALSVLTQVKPDKAMAMLKEIIDGRAGEMGVADAPDLTGKDRAVAYLDELDEMVRGKIMSEFVNQSPTLAADLLERLRTFGLVADASGGAGP